MSGQSRSIEVFFSYSHQDEELRKELDKHLTLVWRRGIARNWHDRRIGAGEDFARAIDEHLNSAQIILLLVSADFLASDYCYGVEMTRALERHAAGEARVIPIILRHVDWKAAPISPLECLPVDGKPVTAWRDRDEAFRNVASGIRDVVDELVGDDGASETAGPPAVARRRTLRPRLQFLLAVLATLLLVAAVARYQPFRRAPDAPHAASTPATDDVRRTKLAFAAGWAVALAGQSSGNAPQAMFGRALSQLGVSADQVQDLDDRYELIEGGARDGTLRYEDFEKAKSVLLSQVGDRLKGEGPQPAATAVFGHDTGALLLLLRHWDDARKEGDAAATAEVRVASLQRSANGVALPAALAERIHHLRASDLADDAKRQSVERTLNDTVRHFEMPAP